MMDGFYHSHDDIQQRDAAALRIILLSLRGEYIQKDLYSIASGYYYSKDEVQKLCALIEECGGEIYMEALRKCLPKNAEVDKIYNWWKRQQEGLENAVPS